MFLFGLIRLTVREFFDFFKHTRQRRFSSWVCATHSAQVLHMFCVHTNQVAEIQKSNQRYSCMCLKLNKQRTM